MAVPSSTRTPMVYHLFIVLALVRLTAWKIFIYTLLFESLSVGDKL